MPPHQRIDPPLWAGPADGTVAPMSQSEPGAGATVTFESFYPPRPRRRWIWIAAAALVLVAVAGVVVLRGPGSLTVSGTVSTQFTGSPTMIGRECFTTGDNSEIKSGAEVVIADAAGKSLAVGKLAPGIGVADTLAVRCVFAFRVSGVKKGAGPYEFRLGTFDPYIFTEKDAGDLLLSIDD